MRLCPPLQVFIEKFSRRLVPLLPNPLRPARSPGDNVRRERLGQDKEAKLQIIHVRDNVEPSFVVHGPFEVKCPQEACHDQEKGLINQVHS